MKAIGVQTHTRQEYIDITAQVKDAVEEENIKEGICIVFCPHTTAALTINENADPAVGRDIFAHLNALIPEDKGYTHAEGNSDAHIKSVFTGSSLNIIVAQGTLQLGRWQGIYFCEFDGPRKRKVFIKTLQG